jgi:tetratricopeptide (TPR) repeat protein
MLISPRVSFAGTTLPVLLLLVAAFARLSIAAPSGAQEEKDAPSVEKMIGELRSKLEEVQKHEKALQRYIDTFDHTGKDDAERKKKATEFEKEQARLFARVRRSTASVDRILRPLSEAKKDELGGVTAQHYIQAMEVLVAGQQSGRAVQFGGKAINLFRKDFDVRARYGDALLEFALGLDDERFDDYIEEAEKSFLRAKALKSEHWRPYFGLYRIQEALGEDEKALEFLDTALEQPNADEEIDRPRIRRGQLLMRLGKLKEAAKQFDTSLARKQSMFDACVLASRCYVLSGDAKKAERVFERLKKDEGSTVRVAQAEADMLWALGRKEEARNALAISVPPSAKKGESFDEQYERQSGQAMMSLLANWGDWEKARRKLPAILGHSFITQMPKKDDPETYEPTNVDYNPTFMLYLLQRAEKTQQYWAEEVLATLSQFALKSYKTSRTEEFVEVQLFEFEERDELRSEDSRAEQLDYLESYVGTPDFRGALIAAELCKVLRG